MVMGDLVNEVDVAVLGGGPGGYSAAFRCAELGLETVVIDAGKRLGGACLYEGCIPSKALLHVAAVIGEAERAKEFGLDFGEPRITLDPLRKWKAERVVGKLARGLASVAKARKVEVVGGRGAFEDSRSIRVGGEEPQVVGYVGLELGQVYAALGSRVTVVEMTDGLLPGVDRELVQPLQRRCEKMFAAIFLKTKVTGLKEAGGAIEAAIEGQESLAFDRVLVAVGRRAVSDGLGLQATKVKIGERGLIAVDERCRSADPHIYAVGDVTGDPMLAHRAMRQGKVAAEAIAGRAAAFDNVAIPAVVFTDPEVAWVGLMEAEARRAGRQLKVTKFPWAASGRAASIGRSDGLTKLVVDAATNRVLGVGIVGPGAGELIAEASLAVETAVTAEDLALTIHAHPTLSEGLMEAAESLLHQGGAS